MPAQSAAMRSTRAPAGTTTMTTTATSSTEGPHTQGAGSPRIQRRLVLRAEQEESPQSETSARPNRRIHWAEDVVNNEGMGKKSSKICCIYHKPRAVGESSDESSSDSSSGESDSDDDGSAKPSGKGRRGHQHDHKDHECHDHGVQSSGQGEAGQRPKNAYEQIPKN